ncbi:hypothetical protein KFK09_023573 [Dendrobium nobile]|uniref:Uncharacterized protein n=1 Tax=Dendrobium nobile TaxID=94219 RepID=A0A8T3AAK6_DENNO|nr:hypothetical protein KFK09_023573 [Dendrobium nobile]
MHTTRWESLIHALVAWWGVTAVLENSTLNREKLLRANAEQHPEANQCTPHHQYTVDTQLCTGPINVVCFYWPQEFGVHTIAELHFLSFYTKLYNAGALKYTVPGHCMEKKSGMPIEEDDASADKSSRVGTIKLRHIYVGMLLLCQTYRYREE